MNERKEGNEGGKNEGIDEGKKERWKEEIEGKEGRKERRKRGSVGVREGGKILPWFPDSCKSLCRDTFVLVL